MMQTTKFMLNCEEVAIVCALRAERIFDTKALPGNLSIVPDFVSFLYQSLEMSIKHASIASGLVTYDEMIGRNKKEKREMYNGHDIKKLAELAAKKLGVPAYGIAKALTFKIEYDIKLNYDLKLIIEDMICNPKYENTRISYAKRCLGYTKGTYKDFGYFKDLEWWIAAVKQTAQNLPVAVDILSQLKESPSKTGRFQLKPTRMRKSKVKAVWH